MFSVDLVIILMHVGTGIYEVGRPVMNLNADWSIGEIYQYIKEAWIAFLLVFIFIKNKCVGYLLWAALFFYILMDDALQIHEETGAYLAQILGFENTANMNSIELFIRSSISMIAPAIVCSIIFAGIVCCYKQEDSVFQARTKRFILLFVLLVFFSVLVDGIAYSVGKDSTWSFALDTIEDGGEMLIMTLIYLSTLKFWLEDY